MPTKTTVEVDESQAKKKVMDHTEDAVETPEVEKEPSPAPPRGITDASTVAMSSQANILPVTHLKDQHMSDDDGKRSTFPPSMPPQVTQPPTPPNEDNLSIDAPTGDPIIADEDKTTNSPKTNDNESTGMSNNSSKLSNHSSSKPTVAETMLKPSPPQPDSVASVTTTKAKTNPASQPPTQTTSSSTTTSTGKSLTSTTNTSSSRISQKKGKTSKQPSKKQQNTKSTKHHDAKNPKRSLSTKASKTKGAMSNTSRSSQASRKLSNRSSSPTKSTRETSNNSPAAAQPRKQATTQSTLSQHGIRRQRRQTDRYEPVESQKKQPPQKPRRPSKKECNIPKSKQPGKKRAKVTAVSIVYCLCCVYV